ncbi:unnamed protein product [Cunninghamella blakesleeana]
MNGYNKQYYWQKLCLIVLLLLLLSLSTITCSIVCIEHNNPLLVSLKHQPTKLCDTLSTTLEKKSTSITNSTSKNQMYYDLHCLDNNATCDSVHQTLDTAIKLTLKTIQLEQPLYLNISFFSFCDQFNQCLLSDNNNNSNNKEVSIGQAFPSVSYLMIDTSDNTTRVYPQAILKQFSHLDSKPQWYKYDIIAQFNSDINWFFEGNDGSIDSTQTDLLRSMLHELVHGLGFCSSWSDDLYQKFQPYVNDLPPFLTPLLLNPPQQVKKFHDQETEKGNQPFWGFVEYPFDKFLQYQTINLSIVTNLLDNWENANVLFKTIYDMINGWVSNDLNLYAQSVYQGSTTAREIVFKLPHHNESLFTMETSLIPFTPGSSLSHVDFLNYHNGPDYLMTYLSKPGISVKELTQKFDSPNPISPKLLHVLAALGYRIQPSMNIKHQYITLRPSIIFWEPPKDLVGTSANPSASPMVVPNGPARIPSPSPSDVPNTSSTSSFVSLSFSSSYFILLIFIYLFYFL